jgi:hypothetical protein
MHNDDTLIECKTVLKGNKQITIKLDGLRLVSYHAALQNRGPRLHVEIGEQRWVMLPEIDYSDLCDGQFIK